MFVCNMSYALVRKMNVVCTTKYALVCKMNVCMLTKYALVCKMNVCILTKYALVCKMKVYMLYKICFGVQNQCCMYYEICFGVQNQFCMYYEICFGVLSWTCQHNCPDIVTCSNHSNCNWKWAFVLTLYNMIAWKCYHCNSSSAQLPLLPATYQPTHVVDSLMSEYLRESYSWHLGNVEHMPTWTIILTNRNFSVVTLPESTVHSSSRWFE